MEEGAAKRCEECSASLESFSRIMQGGGFRVENNCDEGQYSISAKRSSSLSVEDDWQ